LPTQREFKRGLPVLRSDALYKVGWGFMSEHFFNGIGIKWKQAPIDPQVAKYIDQYGLLK
jgi:hypothetical protein